MIDIIYREEWNSVILKGIKDGTTGHFLLDRENKCFLSGLEIKERNDQNVEEGLLGTGKGKGMENEGRRKWLAEDCVDMTQGLHVHVWK